MALMLYQCHYSVQKASQWMGLGIENVCVVPTDDNGILRMDELKRLVKNSRDEGKEPYYVHTTAAGTVLGAIDPLDEVAKFCEKENLWMHVDVSINELADINSKLGSKNEFY